jgi:hypothetical protein
MICPVCQSQTNVAFTAKVLQKYDAEYRVCPNCGYLFASSPHWLDEAYLSPIASTDTGLVKRNITITGKLASFIYLNTHKKGKGRYVDVAGGYGMLTRMMRDLGFDFYWQDKYCGNLLAQGFEYIADEQAGECDAVTAFEVLEHLTNPVEFIKKTMLATHTCTMIFSTLLYDGEPPRPDEWWYYAFQTGQHIGFFQRKTLEVIGEKLNLNFFSSNKIHVLSRNKISQPMLKISTNDIFSRFFPYWIQFRLGSRTEADQSITLKNLVANSTYTDNCP